MSDQDRIAALESSVAALTQRLTGLEDVHAIRCLHHLYGYYIDKCLYRETVELFTDDCEVHFFGGIYRGKAGAKRLYIDRFQKNFTFGNNGPVDGFLLDHMQMQDVVTVAADGQTAKARFRCFMAAGRHKDHGAARQWWEGGLYENDYRKEDGVWKIHVLNYVPQWHADFESGWANTRLNFVPFLDKTIPDDPTGPDELKPDTWLWPTHKVVPFHSPHPVNGSTIEPERLATDQA